MFLIYHPFSNGREDTFVYWVGHLDVFSLISSYPVELFLLHLKVIDGKFKERPFSPILISVAFQFGHPRTQQCTGIFVLKELTLNDLNWGDIVSLTKQWKSLTFFVWINRALSLSSEICYQSAGPSAIMNVVYCTTTLVLQGFLWNELQTIGFDYFLFYLLSVALLQFLLFSQSPFL